MSYDYTVDELQRLTRLNMSECPRHEEGEWLYMIRTAALEARIRLESGNYACPLPAMYRLCSKLERKVTSIRKVARLRGEAF
jgi:hypothetical protein